MLETYTAGCHCGAVRFEVDLDLGNGTGKCNCTFCAKARLWTVKSKPENFRLLCDEAEMVDYQLTNHVAHHLFCRRCGIRPYEWVDIPNMTGEKYVNINVACLDCVDIDALLAAPISYYDGLHDNWGSTPAEVRHL
jgi:hypothetical protein